MFSVLDIYDRLQEILEGRIRHSEQHVQEALHGWANVIRPNTSIKITIARSIADLEKRIHAHAAWIAGLPPEWVYIVGGESHGNIITATTKPEELSLEKRWSRETSLYSHALAQLTNAGRRSFRSARITRGWPGGAVDLLAFLHEYLILSPSSGMRPRGWEWLFLAAEAGLWAMWLLGDEVVFIMQPSVMTFDQLDRLHNETGPAVVWENDVRYAWHGVAVPDYVIVNPQAITISDITTCRDVEVRRIMMDRYGIDRYILDVRARPLHEDGTGKLYSIRLPHDEPIKMIRVINATPEKDGSFKEYWLRVPPSIETAKEGVAWTFQKTEEEYRVQYES